MGRSRLRLAAKLPIWACWLLSIDSDESLGLSMPAYIGELIRLLSAGPGVNIPAVKHLFRCDKPGTVVDHIQFLSLLMKLMYLAKRVRPDILLACSHLATRANTADTHDRTNLRRIVKSTKSLQITLRPEKLELECWADASYGIHSNCKGHTELLYTVGGMHGFIFAKSVKQKCVSRSSSKSKLIAADTSMPYILNLRALLYVNLDTPSLQLSSTKTTSPPSAVGAWIIRIRTHLCHCTDVLCIIGIFDKI